MGQGGVLMKAGKKGHNFRQSRHQCEIPLISKAYQVNLRFSTKTAWSDPEARFMKHPPSGVLAARRIPRPPNRPIPNTPAMNRRHFLYLAAPALLLPSCKTARPVKPAPGPAILPPSSDSFQAGPVPRRLPAGIPVSFSSCPVRGSYAAMTFDDGPHAQHTPRLLDMLARWRIKATFYLIGRNAASHPGIVRRIVAEGHEVANHSWSHPSLSKLSDDAVRSELRRTHDTIVNACGTAPLTYRPPYGAITAAQKQWIAREFGYPTILWSVDPNDWKDRNAGLVSSRILSASKPGSIILAHDIHASTINAMPSTLPVLARRGIRFLTVSQLITQAYAGGGPLALEETIDAPQNRMQG